MRVLSLIPLSCICLAALLAGCRGGTDPSVEHHHEPTNLPPVGPTVAVALDGKTVDVDLSTVAREGGSSSVAIVAVFKAAFPSEDTAQLHFDLVGSDGFRPMARPKCTRLLSGGEVAKAHLDPVKHDTSYDPDLQLPGCYHVHAVVRIEATR